MAVQSEPLRKNIGLNTPVLNYLTLNWEMVFYLTLFVLAVLTRFYDVGARVMSHDESLHTVYSWNLYVGKGYLHDPLMHGPFLFHLNALMYFLFGDSDYTARIAPAIFGVVLVILPYWLRPWLGRLGALAASVMFLISPGILYYARYIRNESFINVFTVLMVIALFQYMRTRRSLWLYVGTVAISLMLSTKEVAYIHGFIGATFIALVWMWENIGDPRYRRVAIGVAGGLLLLGIGIAAVSSNPQLMSATAEASETPTSFLTESVGLLIKFSGLILGIFIVWIGTDRRNRPMTKTLDYLYHNHLTDLLKAMALAVIIFVVLHTTFFSNIRGLYTGTIGAVTYWLAQQEVQRGSQPWYYYLLLVPMYEFLPVLIGLIGGFYYLLRRRAFPAFADAEVAEVVTEPDQPNTSGQTIWPSDGGMFAAFAIYFTLNAFTIYSWAGEKMPWLTVHMTLPFILLAAHILQNALGQLNWAEARRHGGWILGAAILLLIPVALVLFSTRPFQSQSLQAINETSQFIAAAVVFIVLGVVIWQYGRRMGGELAKRVALVALLIPLTLLTIRFTWLLSYVNYDYVNEMLVYAHASPDVKLALEQIDDISRRTVGDKMIKVAYDNDSTWPLEWYLREFPNRAYYGETPTREALDAPIVIVGSANESKVKPFLGDNYISFRYRLVWWPIEDYKNLTLAKLWEDYVSGPPPPNPAAETAEARAARRETVRQNWARLGKILFYRDYDSYELNEWPFVHRFFLYVRKDVATDIWDYQSGPVDLIQTQSVDPYEGKRTELEAVQVWGNNGNGDGQFLAPRNLAIAPDGTIYVADSGNHRIQAFDPDGNFLLKWGSEGAGPDQFSEPWGIAVGPDGAVYVADTWNHRIQAFSPTGAVRWSSGTFVNAQSDTGLEPGNFWGPRDIAVDATGNLYVTDTGNKRVQKFGPNGQFLQMWGTGGVIPGAFEEPVGIEIDSQGNIYVADTWNRRIQKFDADFNFIKEWPVVGWDSESVVNKPFMAIDAEDRLFISDPESYRVTAFDSDGTVLTTWGQYGQDLASFALPLGLDFNNDGQLLVIDSDNNRVSKFLVPDVALQLPSSEGGSGVGP